MLTLQMSALLIPALLMRMQLKPRLKLLNMTRNSSQLQLMRIPTRNCPMKSWNLHSLALAVVVGSRSRCRQQGHPLPAPSAHLIRTCTGRRFDCGTGHHLRWLAVVDCRYRRWIDHRVPRGPAHAGAPGAATTCPPYCATASCTVGCAFGTRRGTRHPTLTASPWRCDCGN